jgi:hypothetical protein
MAGNSLGLDVWLILSEEDKETSLCSCMLNCEPHERLD